MATSDLVASQLPGGDDIPTWLTAVLSVASTLGAWWAWRPIGGWLGKRLEADRQARARERGDAVALLQTQLQATHAEMLELRQDLGEERELRMALAVENAVQRERIENLERSLGEEKEECRQAINRLRTEVRELRQQLRGAP